MQQPEAARVIDLWHESGYWVSLETDEDSQKEIADYMGMHYSTVSRLINNESNYGTACVG